jgi:hypothetical protein
MDNAGKDQQPRHNDTHGNAGKEGQGNSGEASQDEKNRDNDSHAARFVCRLRRNSRNRGCHEASEKRQGARLRGDLMRCKQQFQVAFASVALK